jgi:hypothetical protein
MKLRFEPTLGGMVLLQENRVEEVIEILNEP